MATLPVQTNTFYLAGSGVTIGATSVTITSFTDIYGNILTIANFGAKGYGSLEPDTTNEESFTFTGVTANTNGTYTLTGVSTALAKSPFTETSGLVRGHSGGTKMVISDTSAFWNRFGNIDNQNTWADIQTFSVPAVQSTNPTLSTQVANKSYVDGIAIAGAPNASTSVKGIGTVSVAPVSPTAPIFVGDNDTRVPPVNTSTLTTGRVAALAGNNVDVVVGSGNTYVTQTGLQHNAEKYSVDSGTGAAYVVTLSPVPTSLTIGMVVYMKAVNANTVVNPTVNINGLGAKTIVKLVNTPLVIGDIAANQFCELVYDGINFVLTSPASLPFVNSKNGSFTTVFGATTITHGLGRIPSIIRLFSVSNNGASTANTGSFCHGVYSGGGQSCAYVTGANGFSAAANTSSASVVYRPDSNTTNFATGTIANVTSTSFDITWVQSGTGAPGGSISWEAE